MAVMEKGRKRERTNLSSNNRNVRMNRWMRVCVYHRLSCHCINGEDEEESSFSLPPPLPTSTAGFSLLTGFSEQ